MSGVEQESMIFALSRQFYLASITEMDSPSQEYFKYKEPLEDSTLPGKGHPLLVSDTLLGGTGGNAEEQEIIEFSLLPDSISIPQMSFIPDSQTVLHVNVCLPYVWTRNSVLTALP